LSPLSGGFVSKAIRSLATLLCWHLEEDEFLVQFTSQTGDSAPAALAGMFRRHPICIISQNGSGKMMNLFEVSKEIMNPLR
jgi:hypothetical protein